MSVVRFLPLVMTQRSILGVPALLVLEGGHEGDGGQPGARGRQGAEVRVHHGAHGEDLGKTGRGRSRGIREVRTVPNEV